jgi:DnaJ like chaperone protein
MRWPVTLLGAAAGLAIASIPGALLGGVLGHSLDRRLQIRSWKGLIQRLGWSGGELDDNDLLFILLGRLAKCDGRVRETHIAQTRAEMRRLSLDTEQQRRAIEAFNRGKTGDDGLLLPLRRLRKRPEKVRSVLSSCWRLAAAEPQISERKRNLILLWGRWAGCTPGEVLDLQPTASQHNPGKARESSVAPRARNPYEEALQLLGVRETSESGEIKRAYRRLLSQYHPDKLAGAGASTDAVREATEKTRELHSAYTLVRERHGF